MSEHGELHEYEIHKLDISKLNYIELTPEEVAAMYDPERAEREWRTALARTVIQVLRDNEDLRREFLAALGYQAVDTPMVYQDENGKQYKLSYLAKLESESA